MKRLCGFALFCIALGMLIGLLISHIFWCSVIILILLLVGYNLFVC